MNRDMLTEWVIFCPGPSLKGLKLSDVDKYEQSQAIAVNGAVLKRFPAKYWAMIDSDAFTSVLHDITAGQIIEISKQHILWIPDNWLTHFEKWSHDYWYFFRIFFYDTWPTSRLSELMPFARHLKWDNCSMFAAMALAISKGAEKIKIYGAEMGGIGYFKEGLENYRTNHKEKRWQDEREKFEQIVKECDDHGIKIERIIH